MNGTKWRMIAILLLMALALACTPESDTVVPAPTVLPVQVEAITFETPSPSPTPPLLDLAPYRIEAEATVYDLLPLLNESDEKLLHAGFSGECELTLLCTDADETMLLLERLDLSTGVRTTLYADRPEVLSALPYNYRFYSMDPPLYEDYANETLVLFTRDGRHRTRFSIADRVISACCPCGDGVLLYDSMQDVLLYLDPDGTAETRFSTDFRFRYAEVLGFDASGSIAFLSARDGYTGEDITVMLDTATGEPIGQNEGNLYLSASESGVSILRRSYDWSGSGNRTDLSFWSADGLDSAERSELTISREEYYPTISSLADGFLFEDWNGPYTLMRTDPTGGTVRTLRVPLDRYQARVDEIRAQLVAESPLDEEDWEVYLYPQTFSDGCDSRYVLTQVTCQTEWLGLLLWDTESTAPVRNVPMTFADPMLQPVHSGVIDYGAYAERIERIYNTYGVRVLLGEDASLEINSHTAETISLEEGKPMIDETLDALEGVLTDFPSGFFETLCGDGVAGILLELCGTIRANYTESLDYPSALTSLVDHYRLIVFDVHYSYDLRYTLFHEIAHMIDSKLDSVAGYDSIYWSDSGWDALNPKGFSYYYAYNDSQGRPYDAFGSDDYTRWDSRYLQKGNADRVYFLNVYSKTFPTEDRAVLFGTLMQGTDSDDVLRCPHLLEKLTYYCKAIRTYCDPDRHWDTPTAWEQRLAALRND